MIRLAAVMTMTALVVAGCGRSDQQLTEWQRVKSGGLDVLLLSPHGAPRHGRDTMVMEFRSAVDGKLADVGDVRATATMAMTGMPMIGSLDVTRTNTAGRYNIVSQLEMAGTWRVEVRWQNGLAPVLTTFAATIQ